MKNDHKQWSVDEAVVSAFISEHELPLSFAELANNHYMGVARWLQETKADSARPRLVGINGAQGTGKSTLADFLRSVLGAGLDWAVAVLSIDDFYLTKRERLALARSVHPLLSTRGVPGTHDLPMLITHLSSLKALNQGEQRRLPRFDKAKNDRAEPDSWPVISGPIDLILLEGWCVGSGAQQQEALAQPINDLEREKDGGGEWRRWVNDQLATAYADLFSQLDALVFLKAPSFDAVHRWRLEQEHKLAASQPKDSPGIMDDGEIAGFIQLYERITRHNLETLPDRADVVLELSEEHGCVRSRYRA